MPKRMKPSGKYNWDNDFWVGQGVKGLGKQELNRRVKQQNALAAKAFKAAGGGKKESLTSKDVANVYRGFYHQELANSMQVLSEYDKYGMYMKKKPKK
jgi:phage-related protein